jgi:membrane-bound lytic murein transglycosylase MltF
MDDFNKMLFAFASYNAGPAKVKKLRKKAAVMGLNPNVWFGNVEIAAAKVIGRETVQYVSNIYKYYIAYRMVTEQRERKQKLMKKNQKK